MALYIKARNKPHFGANVSKSNMRTNREFKVNYQVYKYPVGNTFLKLKCNHRIYRTINKYGSFERYVIHCRNLHPDIAQIRNKLLRKIYNK